MRAWLKDKDYVALAYMTGILANKKIWLSFCAEYVYRVFDDRSWGDWRNILALQSRKCQQLCEKYEMSFEEAKTWYDGYQLVAHRQWKDECYSMYNPKSVVEAMLQS